MVSSSFLLCWPGAVFQLRAANGMCSSSSLAASASAFLGGLETLASLSGTDGGTLIRFLSSRDFLERCVGFSEVFWDSLSLCPVLARGALESLDVRPGARDVLVAVAPSSSSLGATLERGGLESLSDLLAGARDVLESEEPDAFAGGFDVLPVERLFDLPEGEILVLFAPEDDFLPGGVL